MADVFGKAFMDFMNGEKGTLIIKRDDGYSQEDNIEKYFYQYIKFPDYEKEVLKEVKGRILDIGAGAGRHSLWLQGRNFETHAVDISPLAVEVMQKRGVKKVYIMPLERLSFPRSYFDTVLLMFNNFGLGGTITRTKQLLRKIYEITTDNGKIITTIRDPLATENPRHLEYHEMNRKKNRPIGQITFRLEYKGEASDWFDLLILTPSELESLAKEEKWEVQKIVRGNDGMYGVVLKKVI